MQGKKQYQEKLFNDFRLSDHVPKGDFYGKLKDSVDLRFLYPLTKGYYGDSGQKSIDPVVFFKLCLAGYLENIISDRKLIAHCSMRMDILYFQGYDIDEELPWHNTISRTRQLFPEAVFEKIFTKALTMCVDKGMVSGYTQAVDSAPIKAIELPATTLFPTPKAASPPIPMAAFFIGYTLLKNYYFLASYLKCCPPIEASNIKPPLTWVKTATPF